MYGGLEVAEFKTYPNLELIIVLRYLNSAGKRPDMEPPGDWHFAPMAHRMVDRHNGGERWVSNGATNSI